MQIPLLFLYKVQDFELSFLQVNSGPQKIPILGV